MKSKYSKPYITIDKFTLIDILQFSVCVQMIHFFLLLLFLMHASFRVRVMYCTVCTVNMLCVDQSRHNISVASLPTNGRVNMIINTSSRSYSLLHVYKYVPLLQLNFTFL